MSPCCLVLFMLNLDHAKDNMAQLGLGEFIHSFISDIYIAPLQDFFSEALPNTARTLNRSFTPKRMSNCEWRTCPGSLRGGLRWIRTRNPPAARHQIYPFEVDSNPQPSGCKAPNIPLHHRAPQISPAQFLPDIPPAISPTPGFFPRAFQ